MSSIGEGFKNIILAGIGVMAYTSEKGKEIVDQLVEKGELTLDQGRELNEELRRKADDATKGVRESALEAAMKVMTPQERDAFVAKAAEFAKSQNEEAAKAAAAAEDFVGEVAAEVEAVEEVVVEAVEDIADAVEKVVAEVTDES